MNEIKKYKQNTLLKAVEDLKVRSNTIELDLNSINDYILMITEPISNSENELMRLYADEPQLAKYCNNIIDKLQPQIIQQAIKMYIADNITPQDIRTAIKTVKQLQKNK